MGALEAGGLPWEPLVTSCASLNTKVLSQGAWGPREAAMGRRQSPGRFSGRCMFSSKCWPPVILDNAPGLEDKTGLARPEVTATTGPLCHGSRHFFIKHVWWASSGVDLQATYFVRLRGNWEKGMCENNKVRNKQGEPLMGSRDRTEDGMGPVWS